MTFRQEIQNNVIQIEENSSWAIPDDDYEDFEESEEENYNGVLQHARGTMIALKTNHLVIKMVKNGPKLSKINL